MQEVRDKVMGLPGEAQVTFTREALLDITGMETKLELVIEGDSLETVNELSTELVERLALLPLPPGE